MKKKQYQQYCPMSYALDVIGDRWTLHIVRDLGFGARRFTDLQSGLPGLASNLLSKRLKEMEENNLVAKRRLPPPASSTVYELTAQGRSLHDVIKTLSNWGTQYLEVPAPKDDFLGIIPAMSSLYRFYDFDTANGMTLVCEFHANGEVIKAQMDNGQLAVSIGVADNPDVTLEILNLKTLIALVNHVTSIESALSEGHIKYMAGDIVAFQAFVDSFPRQNLS
jgi:DNA-binding HxlR family transcriptional regulator